MDVFIFCLVVQWSGPVKVGLYLAASSLAQHQLAVPVRLHELLQKVPRVVRAPQLVPFVDLQPQAFQGVVPYKLIS